MTSQGFSIALFAVVAAAVLVGLWYFIRYYQTRYLLDLSLIIESPSVAREETIKFKIRVSPSQDVTVPLIKTKLRCVKREKIDTGGRGFFDNRPDLITWLLATLANDTSFGNEIAVEYDGEVSGEDFVFRKGEEREFEAEFPVPGDALHTKHVGDLQIRWYLVVEALLPSSPPAMVEKEVAIVYKSAMEKGEVPGDASQLFSPHLFGQGGNDVNKKPGMEKPLVSPPQETAPFSHLEFDSNAERKEKEP